MTGPSFDRSGVGEPTSEADDVAVGSFEEPPSPAPAPRAVPRPKAPKDPTSYVIFECIGEPSEVAAGPDGEPTPDALVGVGSTWRRHPTISAHGNDQARAGAAEKILAAREGGVGALIAIPVSSVQPEEFERDPTPRIRRRRKG